jgi:predicted dehydrogenase
MTRRELTGAAAMTALSYSRILGANDRIGLGVIGTGQRGAYVMTRFQLQPEIEVRALCDVYAARIDEAKSKAAAARGFAQHERLLELKEIDAVLIGSPDHWHKQHAVDAMQAGKDVYVEKPLCRLIPEGLEMVKTARLGGRICQVGLQQRSGQVYLEARERFITSGAIGDVVHVKAFWNNGPLSAERRGRPMPAEKPSNLDWARFLGPAKWREWTPLMYFNFRAFLELNGGLMTDFGHHWMDTIHMYLGERAPYGIFATGMWLSKDGRTAPDEVTALFEYDRFRVVFESLRVGNPGEYGIEFHGDKGKLFVNRNRYEFTPAGKGATPVGSRFPGDITTDHVRNFLDCVKSRKRPNADVALAYKSIQPPLLAVQSMLEKRRLHWDPDREELLPF